MLSKLRAAILPSSATMPYIFRKAHANKALFDPSSRLPSGFLPLLCILFRPALPATALNVRTEGQAFICGGDK